MEQDSSAVVCPYDESHIIDKSRIHRHLIKCSRNFPPRYKEPCPYNATHLVSPSDLQKHIEECPNRQYIESERYFSIPKKHGSIISCPPSAAESIGHDEMWDLSSKDDFSSIACESLYQMPITRTSVEMPAMRAPMRLSQVLMMEIPKVDIVEDMESVTSSMGRGKFINKASVLRKIGRGRGIIFQDDLKVGASALTDVEDLESVTSSIGRGIVHRAIRNDLRYDSDMDDTRSVVSNFSGNRNK